MRHLLLALGLVFALPGHTSDLPAKEMLHVVFRIESPELPPAHFGAQPRKLWRVGMRYLRVEEPYNPETGLQLLIISRAPDSWLIDRRTRRAKHVVDPGPSIDVHMPIITSMPPGSLRRLEFGNELTFFQRHGAQTSPVSGQPALKKWRLAMDGYRLDLLVRSGDRPHRLHIVQPGGYTFTVVYERYEYSPHIDMKRFNLPAGLVIEKAQP